MLARKPKLPVRQLLILSICRFAEPIAFTSVLPYLPELIESVGVPEQEIAKWVGITTAVSSLTQALMAVSWGRASDRHGRKPVILLGLTFTMIFSLVFGMSKSLPMIVISRLMIGFMNGNVGIIRTMVAEMVPEKELQPRAFSIMPLVWTIGSIFGPAFGGALAHPAEKHPGLFGGSKFFKENPFLLPNLIAAGFFIVGITTGYLFLHETLEAKKGHTDAGLVLGQMLTRACTRRRRKNVYSGMRGVDERSALLGEEESGTPKPSQGNPEQVQQAGWRQVLKPQSTLILITYALMSLHTMAFDSLLPVFLHLPVQSFHDNPDVKLPFKFVGGFGIDSQEIGVFYTLTGTIGMIIQFVVFPVFAKRFGVLKCLKVSALFYPFLYFFTPSIALVPQSLSRITIFFLILGKLSAAIFAFPCTTILLTNSASSLNILGTLNGVGTSVSAIGRAAGPAILGQVFSLGLRKGYIIIPWWTLALFSCIGATPVFWIVETDGFQAQPEPVAEFEPEHEPSIPPSKHVDDCRSHRS